MTYIIIILILIGYWYGLSLFFKKAGKTSWHAFVPYLRIKALIEIFEKKKWKWIIMSFIPVVNLFVYSNLLGEISSSLRRYSFWEHTLAVVFGWVWFPIILQKDEEKFHGINGVKEGEKAPKVTKAREWTDALLFALFAAYFIRTFIFEIYTIPTSSMEGTLKVGDFLVVSKFHYGSRVPNTPIAFPLVHHSFPQWIPILGGKKSYLEWINLPYNRLPKFQEVKRNDMVVFNFPANDTTTKFPDSQWPYYDMVRFYEKELKLNQSDAQNAIKNGFGGKHPGLENYFINSRGWDPKFSRNAIQDGFDVITRPVDKRENYIKRCVGMPGDKLEVKGSVLFINDKIAYEAENVQFTYLVNLKKAMTSNNISQNDPLITRLMDMGIIEIEPTGNKNSIAIYTNSNLAKKVESLPDVSFIEKYIHNDSTEFLDKRRMYPNTDKAFKNNIDNYGPIIIPSKGMTVSLNKENYLMYERCISVYENNNLEINNGQAYINGKVATEYTFKMNYYWMMGDNRHRSQDSRYWGFVPEDHVVGKAWILIASRGAYDGFRFNRLFKSIHGKWAPKESKYID